MVITVYENLKAEMVRQNIKPKDLSEMIGINYNTLNYKLRGESPIKLHEALKIREVLKLEEVPLEELFG